MNKPAGYDEEDGTPPSPAYRALMASMDEAVMWEAMTLPEQRGLILDRFPVEQWFEKPSVIALAEARADLAEWGRIKARFKSLGGNTYDLEQAVTLMHHAMQSLQGTNGTAWPTPQSATDLLEKHFDPLVYCVHEILHEGLTLLAGKPKKGKSYLALDMSLAMAVGRLAFRHFPTQQRKVLYVSLEDGERRLQTRLRQIQPNIATPPGLDFLYAFPRLGDGALEALTHYATHYQVIIIDVLGRILPSVQTVRKSVNEYNEFTELLGGIQALANAAHVAIVLIDHVRKAGAEDVYDTIMGSQGKWGTADIGLVYERKGEEKDAVLHVAGRDVEEQKLVLTLTEGHLEYLGKGESYELDSEQNRIITILGEERRPLSAPDLMKSLGIHESHYSRFRQVMQRLYNDDRIGRTKRGLYTLYGHDRTDSEWSF